MDSLKFWIFPIHGFYTVNVYFTHRQSLTLLFCPVLNLKWTISHFIYHFMTCFSLQNYVWQFILVNAANLSSFECPNVIKIFLVSTLKKEAGNIKFSDILLNPIQPKYYFPPFYKWGKWMICPRAQANKKQAGLLIWALSAWHQPRGTQEGLVFSPCPCLEDPRRKVLSHWGSNPSLPAVRGSLRTTKAARGYVGQRQPEGRGSRAPEHLSPSAHCCPLWPEQLCDPSCCQVFRFLAIGSCQVVWLCWDSWASSVLEPVSWRAGLASRQAGGQAGSPTWVPTPVQLGLGSSAELGAESRHVQGLGPTHHPLSLLHFHTFFYPCVSASASSYFA